MLTLKEAIAQQADIVCGSVEERGNVVEALHKIGHPVSDFQRAFNENGLIVSLSFSFYTIDDGGSLSSDFLNLTPSDLADLTPANDIYDVSDMD